MANSSEFGKPATAAPTSAAAANHPARADAHISSAPINIYRSTPVANMLPDLSNPSSNIFLPPPSSPQSPKFFYFPTSPRGATVSALSPKLANSQIHDHDHGRPASVSPTLSHPSLPRSPPILRIGSPRAAFASSNYLSVNSSERPPSPLALNRDSPTMSTAVVASHHTSPLSVSAKPRNASSLKLSSLPTAGIPVPAAVAPRTIAVPSNPSNYYSYYSTSPATNNTANQQLQYHQYQQQQLIAAATRSAIPNHMLAGPISPRLMPLGSPGPVTPLTLEDSPAGYLYATEGMAQPPTSLQLSQIHLEKLAAIERERAQEFAAGRR